MQHLLFQGINMGYNIGLYKDLVTHNFNMKGHMITVRSLSK